MNLERDGAERIPEALSEEELRALDELARCHGGMGAGIRIAHDEMLSRILAAGGTMDRIAKARLGDGAEPVRAILFDKQPGANWALGWHQDQTIAVGNRIEVPGFGPWSRKSGIDHAEPPFEYIQLMITLRAHLDAGLDRRCARAGPAAAGLHEETLPCRTKKPDICRATKSGHLWLSLTGVFFNDAAQRNAGGAPVNTGEQARKEPWLPSD